MVDAAAPSGAQIAADETITLISADKVIGTAVYNHQSERLGSVHGLMLNKVTGRVAYAIMSFGGFLGLGESFHPLPWSVLTYSRQMEGYVVDLDKDRLANAPRYAAGAAPDWTDGGYVKNIDLYYGTLGFQV